MVPPSEPFPGPHPLPPPDLMNAVLPIRPMTQSWFRFHRLGHDCLYWGLDPRRPYPFRFDAPAGEYGVLYVAADEHGAFIETFGHVTGALRRTSSADLQSRFLSRVDVGRPLRLVDLTGARLAPLGVDNRLLSGDYAVAQRWALAFHEHPDAPDGLLYPSRHDNERLCAAIFERARSAVTSSVLGTLADVSFRPLLLDLLSEYGLAYGET